MSTPSRRAALLVGPLLLASAGQAQLTTRLVATGFNKCLWAGAPRGDERIFLGLKGGRIRIVQNDVLLPTPFLDIINQVSGGSEQGLLGVAFHPDYANNGYFFVNYTDNGGDTVVSRWSVSASDPNLADLTSELVLLQQNQPFDNHNGGCLQFGPDGYLYIGLGDGGSAADPNCNAQNGATWLGKMLRIDVDGGLPYAIPPSNPFLSPGDGILDEIWAFGLRNPWRYSFDRLTGDLYIGDVGQDQIEEIDAVPAGASALNFGWKIMEGLSCFGRSSCAASTPLCRDVAFTDPVHTYTHASGCSVTGGVVYRGCAIPGLQGTYFFADFCASTIWSFRYDLTTGTKSEFMDRTAELAPGGGLAISNVTSFGEDGFGELLIIDHSNMSNGEVFKVVPVGAAEAIAVARNGSGLNSVCYTSTSLPILGNVWTASIDASAHAGATTSFIVAYSAPASGTFIGAGELLLDLAGGTKLFSLAKPSGGGLDAFRVAIPCSSALNGMTAYTQAVILGGQAQLCNGVDVTVGYY